LLALYVQGSNQPRAITLTRRYNAGCEAGALAVKRGTTRPTEAVNPAS